MPAEEAAERLSEAFGRQLTSLLEELPIDENGVATQQLSLVNALLVQLRQQNRRTDILDTFATPPKILRAVSTQASPLELPETGLC